MDGALYVFKARLVAKGFTQTYGVDYEETFSPVADIRAIRILIAIAAYYDYEIWQMDVKTAFLNGHLSEEVYMEQPEGFVDPKYPDHVCKLKRSIYRLKQASMQWNKRFDDEIKKFGFAQNPEDPCVHSGKLSNMERELRVSCYTDVGYLTDADNLKSQTGYVFVLNRGAVDWKSIKQSIFATSSTDAEYIAALMPSKELYGFVILILSLHWFPTI
ncbi:retrotransposon protein, putative, ty1-copia subclass [Tanacetum coccineum]